MIMMMIDDDDDDNLSQVILFRVGLVFNYSRSI